MENSSSEVLGLLGVVTQTQSQHCSTLEVAQTPPTRSRMPTFGPGSLRHPEFCSQWVYKDSYYTVHTTVTPRHGGLDITDRQPHSSPSLADHAAAATQRYKASSWNREERSSRQLKLLRKPDSIVGTFQKTRAEQVVLDLEFRLLHPHNL